MKRKNKAAGIVPDFKAYHKAIVIKTLILKYKYRSKRQKSPEEGPHTYGQLIQDKVPQQFKGERIIFLTNGAGTAGHTHAEQ